MKTDPLRDDVTRLCEAHGFLAVVTALNRYLLTQGQGAGARIQERRLIKELAMAMSAAAEAAKLDQVRLPGEQREGGGQQ